MVFSGLINGKGKGNMLLLICVNLRTCIYPATVRMRLGISSVNQAHFTQRGRSSLHRKQELWSGRKAASRAWLNWQGQSSPSSTTMCTWGLRPRTEQTSWQESPRGAGRDRRTADTWPVPFGFGDPDPSIMSIVGGTRPAMCRTVHKGAG